jgi:hypothetical protein
MPILKPSPVDIVPASTAEAIVAETQRELTAREEERLAAEAAADAAERGAAGGAGDLAFHEWMTAHLDRFVTLLRGEHDGEMRSMVDGAERRARACIERAQVDADMLTSYAHALRGTAAHSAPLGIGAGPAGAAQIVADVEPVAPLVWRPSETHIDVPAAPPRPDPSVPFVAAAAPAVVVPAAPPVVVPPAPPVTVPPAPAVTVPPAPVVPQPPAPVVAAVPVVVPPPAPVVAPPPLEASIVTGEVPVVPAVAVADAAGVPPAPPVGAPPTLAPEPPPPPPPAPPVADAPAPVPAVGEAKDQSRAAKLKEFVHGLPTFAILQVLAVIVVLIIVLIRIG